MKQEAEINAEADKKVKEEAELLNRADSVVFQSEKSIEDLQDKITEDQKNELNECVNKLKKSHGDKNFEQIQIDIDDLNSKFQKISEGLYNQEQTETNDSQTDVEFEEVL